MSVDITALYCCLDDFCKVFEEWEGHRLIPSGTIRQRPGKLSRAEMLFIMVLFHRKRSGSTVRRFQPRLGIPGSRPRIHPPPRIAADVLDFEIVRLWRLRRRR